MWTPVNVQKGNKSSGSLPIGNLYFAVFRFQDSGSVHHARRHTGIDNRSMGNEACHPLMRWQPAGVRA